MRKKGLLIVSLILTISISLLGCKKEDTINENINNPQPTLTIEEKELAKETMDKATDILLKENISIDKGHYLVSTNFDFENDDILEKNIHIMKDNITFSTNDFIVPSLVGVDENLNEYRYIITNVKEETDLYDAFSTIGIMAINNDKTIKVSNIESPSSYDLEGHKLHMFQYSYGNELKTTNAYMLALELEENEENKTYFCSIYLSETQNELTLDELMLILLDGVTISYK